MGCQHCLHATLIQLQHRENSPQNQPSVNSGRPSHELVGAPGPTNRLLTTNKKVLSFFQKKNKKCGHYTLTRVHTFSDQSNTLSRKTNLKEWSHCHLFVFSRRILQRK